MDSLFVATPPEDEIAAALRLWPDLAGRRIRPLLVTAFGDIYIEEAAGCIQVVDALELVCEPVASSIAALEQLFTDATWANERLLVEVLLLAKECGLTRSPERVFGVAPHPSFTGHVRVENMVAMDLYAWHHICAQLPQ
jgi:hypothetical protein